MHAQDERQAPGPGRRVGDGAQPAQRVGVDHVERGLAPERPEEVERDDVPAQRDHLAAVFHRDPEEGQHGAEVAQHAAGAREEIRRRHAREPGGEDERGNAILPEPVHEALDGGFGATPFGGVVFAEDMGDAHD